MLKYSIVYSIVTVKNMWDVWPCGECVHMTKICEENIAVGKVKSLNQP